MVDGNPAMTKALSGGSATFIIPRPIAGNHSLDASFSGTAGFESSRAISTLVVNKAVVSP